ncbi:putative arabinose 5-phosphate isomerase [Chlamydiales bacterium STE3]|nr:putative arabinose 5-phosphate isomerase [Chlamydiales bacterium STE3]
MILNELLKDVESNISFFVQNINQEEVEKAFQLLKKCKGMIFFTGVGKSAIVANKIAVTMTSTGTRAFFVSPIDALHGDIGLIGREDLLVVLSKSGESDELINLIPYVRNKGADIIAIVSNPKSRLAKAANAKVVLPVKRELCPFNMAPTTSTQIQMIFGDVLAVGLMHEKNFSLNDYAMNHPAGSIGKRILLKVSDLMLKDTQIPMALPEDKLIDTLVELSDKKAGCVLVTDQHLQLMGIFTDGDLRRALQRLGSDVLQYRMKDLMNAECRTIYSNSLALEAMQMMENPSSPVMVLPVVDESGCVIGLIKMHDILQSGL